MKELMILGIVVVLVSAALAAMGFRGRDQVVGIDLGTTFSVVAIKSCGEVRVIPDFLSGRRLVPSVVSFLPNGTVAVGMHAAALRRKAPERTIFNSKRFIGRTMDEVAVDAASHPFVVAAHGRGSAGSADAHLAAGFSLPGADTSQPDRWVSPIDVGAEIVRHLGRSVDRFVGYPVSRAVICVPAQFPQRSIEDTQQAFERAGIKVMRVLEEPTAAAVAYNLHKSAASKYVLVYDIGGGTLDTSLLFMSGSAVNVLGVAGDSHLGGSDFDVRLAELLKAKLLHAATVSRAPVGFSPPGCDRNGLLFLAEAAKIELSDAFEVDVSCADSDGSVRSMKVFRQEFERASQDLFERAMHPVEIVLADQMMTASDVDDVVLVGGASRTPMLQTMLRRYFVGTQLHKDIDPDVTVAMGAANILD